MTKAFQSWHEFASEITGNATHPLHEDLVITMYLLLLEVKGNINEL